MGIHDRLFKELLSTFLYEFLELFLPDLAASLDRESIEFLDKEMFTELAEGERREADLVVKARLKGQEAFFVIHLEHQAQSKDLEQFPFRMFSYCSILIQRYRVPVYPIALLSYSSPRKPAPDSYQITFPDFEPLVFRFRTIQLNRLQWQDFVRRENPVAAALMSRMCIKKKDRPAVKTACLRLLGKQNLDKARSMLVSHFVDHYLRLDPVEKMRFHEEVDSLPPEETKIVMNLMTSWEREGLEKGLERGRKEGRKEGREEGREEGLKKGRVEVARRMLARRTDLAFILEVTGLSEEELTALEEEQKP